MPKRLQSLVEIPRLATVPAKWMRWQVEDLLGRMDSESSCRVCGFHGRRSDTRAISDGLALAWELDQRWRSLFDQREGTRCRRCHASLRSEQLAVAFIHMVLRELGANCATLNQCVKQEGVRALRVAEVNAAGTLHKYFARLPNLLYSEFGSTDPKVRSESLEGLSYGDASVDVLVSSETLEHVPDVDTALREIHRVLVPGGFHIFTVPIIWDRSLSRIRAVREDGQIRHLHPPSYHGPIGQESDDRLVFHEFGADFMARLRAAKFETEVLSNPVNPAVFALVSRKLRHEHI